MELVTAAGTGDDRAWECLHARFTPMLRRVAGSYRLSSSDVDDVVQTTWTLLVSHISRLRDPAAVPGWLATTARRECLRVLRRATCERVAYEPQLGDRVDLRADPEGDLLAAERRVVLARALDTLPERHRQLMTLLLAQPAMDYETVSTTLRMPRGSIGPTRARSIARLRCHSELRSVSVTC
ncbi:MAG TPA: sigma-70 family RNA polymerase sigma factor [Solirubrobacteraceae bacterium]|jgi:RNA polymerase sigma factor (sigma-70 family)|nr:sigma-70 family RNA polymerase sigma factor [Solirubrobacteraceae bacterium]